MGFDQGGFLCSIYKCMEQQLFTIVLERQQYNKKYLIWITRIKSTQSRVVCYWYTIEVKEGKLNYSKDRIKKTSKTIQLNREIK